MKVRGLLKKKKKSFFINEKLDFMKKNDILRLFWNGESLIYNKDLVVYKF